MRRIIYTSRSLIGDNPAALEAIMEASIAWNAEVGITGMLWWGGDDFAQVIEGGHDAVGTTMDRIHADRRHTDIEVLVDRPVRSRQFGTWAMRRADGSSESIFGTTFLLGFALSEHTPPTNRLYDIIIATER